jgi:hypothetical protein
MFTFLKRLWSKLFPPKTPDLPGRKKVALIIGHNKKLQGAASEFLGKTEYQYYQFLRSFQLINEKIHTETFDRDEGWGALTRKVRNFDADITIEFHFNSFTSANARGCETLVKIGDQESKVFGKKITDDYCAHFGKRNRGVKKVSTGNRGYNNLSKMRDVACVSVLFEPFFGSNRLDPVTSYEFQDWLERFLLSI